jgi:putative ABC transport system ATP-binding protein
VNHFRFWILDFGLAHHDTFFESKIENRKSKISLPLPKVMVRPLTYGTCASLLHSLDCTAKEMHMNDTIIRLESVTKSYALGRVRVNALRGVTLTIARGELVALAGPSGSGKTTLLNLIGCIDKPDTGRVLIDGVDVTAIPLHRLAPLRRDAIGFVFQTFNLVPVLTAYENIEYPLLLQGVPRAERDKRVREWLARVELTEQMRQRPDQMSGGQRQRVAIARAMAGNPKLVVADEPTANLDSETAARILDLLADINQTTGVTFVFSTHDPDVISRAERVVRIHDGEIGRQKAESRNVFAHLAPAAASAI